MTKENDITNSGEMLQEISEQDKPLLSLLHRICQEVMGVKVSQKLYAEKKRANLMRSAYFIF